jgi:hydrogenase maturation protease
MGNPILTDDGVGIYVVAEVAKRVQRDDVDCAEASVGGMRLLSVIAGYGRVILVDAIQTPGGRPGDILHLRSDDLRCSMHAGCTHDLSLAGTLALGRGLEMALPDDDHFSIVAVEVEDVLTFSEECTPVVAAAIPRAAEEVVAMLGEGPA